MKPTPGKQYTVVSGDFLIKISAQAYGQPEKWRIIFNANSTVLRSDDPNLIFPGEIIFIPFLKERQKLKNDQILNIFEDDGPDAVRLILNDIVVPTLSLELVRTMDTAADGFTGSISWNPGEDEKLDEITRPYSYSNARVYIGGELKMNGTLYGVKPTLNSSQRGKDLEGWSFTADAIDSSMKPPYEVSKTTLRQRAESLIEVFGISVIWDIDDDLKFDKMTASPTETVFSHLLKYAKQRGVLISSTPAGDLLFTRANVDGVSVGTIQEGLQGELEYTAKFDGRKRFNSYKAIGQSPKNSAKFEVAKDDQVPKSRMLTFNNPDSTEGDLKTAAEWKRSSQLSEALTIPFTATSFYGPNDKQWEENTIVTVKSPVLSIPDGFNFLIKRVAFKNNSNGKTAQLSLVPPQVYSGKPIPDIFR